LSPAAGGGADADAGRQRAISEFTMQENFHSIVKAGDWPALSPPQIDHAIKQALIVTEYFSAVANEALQQHGSSSRNSCELREKFCGTGALRSAGIGRCRISTIFLHRSLKAPVVFCGWDATYEECLAVMRIIRRFIRDEKGATAVEYGLIAALVSLAAGGLIASLGDVVQGMYQMVLGWVQEAEDGQI
jgi:pilus assembly protein Flp/PilA